MKHTREILNMEAKYFGGDKHGQSSGIMMKDAFFMNDTIALQKFDVVDGVRHKTVYVAITTDKEKYFDEAVEDFNSILLDTTNKQL